MPTLPTVGGNNNTWGGILNEYLSVSLTDVGALRPIAGTIVTADPFQTPPFDNPLVCDAILHKDFICGVTNEGLTGITGNTVITLNNTRDGDAGQIEVKIDGTGGYTVTLGGDFAVKKDIGGIALVTTLNADNFIGWRNVGGTIVYNIVQVQ